MDFTSTGQNADRSSPLGLSAKGLLADTWWFGMTARLSDEAFMRLATLRASQGFTAVQIVVGVPPDVGLAHPSAEGHRGPAFDLKGKPNQRYLRAAVSRLETLLSLGLTPMVYGAWGYQIDWIGVPAMTEWWHTLVAATRDLPVIYCLTGESSHSLLRPRALLPARSSTDLAAGRTPRGWVPLLRPAKAFLDHLIGKSSLHESRREKWTSVLESVRGVTDRPFLVHPVPSESGFQAVNRPDLLSADTFQTGHSYDTRRRLAHLATEAARDGAAAWINLEPWFEGLRGEFWGDDQLFAYWVTVLTGAMGFCYGAQGIWNVGDGSFLRHWGTQTFEQACALGTPRLLGASHQLFMGSQVYNGSTHSLVREGQLVGIERATNTARLTFFADAAFVDRSGRAFSPRLGRFIASLPATGPVVIVES